MISTERIYFPSDLSHLEFISDIFLSPVNLHAIEITQYLLGVENAFFMGDTSFITDKYSRSDDDMTWTLSHFMVHPVENEITHILEKDDKGLRKCMTL